MQAKNTENLSIDEVMSKLSASKAGLSSSEAENRLKKFGPNEIQSKKASPILKLLKKFIGPISLMLFAITGLSISLGKYIDAYIILGLVVFNALAGFLEEYKADNTLELLKQKLSVMVSVKRNGSWAKLPSKSIVPGDIIRLRMGDIVPADCKAIEGDYVSVDQSMLTGESLPVDKKTGDLLYSSSVVKGGEATGLVVSTGSNTSFGKTTELVKTARTKMHLESDILKLIKYLVIVDLVLIFVVLAYSFFSGLNLITIIPFTLLILLVSVPVALPAAFTVAMAYGTEKLSSKNILVTRLGAIEEASTMNVVCLDKTGTITKNKLSMSKPVEYDSFSGIDVVKYGALASREEDADEIDLSIISFAKANKIDTSKYRVTDFKPFDPSTKMSEATVLHSGRKITVIKGFPDKILSICKLPPAEEKREKELIMKDSGKGYRIIAVAINDGEWKFVGYIPLNDKPREDSATFINELKKLGLKIKMLTGDSEATAKAVASEVGIGDRILDVSSLAGESESQLSELVNKNDGFSGVFPKDKYAIVKALQDSGFHVGMTGDGVNDAPALKQAEVGIAVSNATDVAKSAAAIVLTSDGIEPIVNAIIESRSIFERMITYTINKVSRIFQIAFFLAAAFLILKFLPIRTIQLILMIFLNDIGSIALSTDHEKYSLSPDTWDIKSIFSASVIFGVAAIIEISIITFAGLSFFGLNHSQLQTLLFFSFIVSIELMLLSIRSRGHFFSTMPSLPVILQIVLSILIAGALSFFGILMTPIDLDYILFSVGVSALFLVIVDYIKYFLYKNESEFKSL
ncbi:MAG: plasma-membrane proton-efflux P-type ATPase [Candidatus Parvarchaeota archaeon]|nr:plasma-membrane proton-efflux P-type ATPase [Candidatus Parvarchaeota archaeon]